MSSNLYIERLHESLKVAIEKRIIRDWTIDGHHVVFHRGSLSLAVPVFEAREYLDGLFLSHELESAHSKASNTEK